MGKRVLFSDNEIVSAIRAVDLGKNVSAPYLEASTGGLTPPDHFFSSATAAGHSYRVVCGVASRRQLSPELRSQARTVLFRARSSLERRLENTIQEYIDRRYWSVNRLLQRQVFGFCKKQGVSFRLSLSTCVPSKMCGGGCYAHDGRERVTSTILSGCYNTVVARMWQAGRISDEQLRPHIRRAITLAVMDRDFAFKEYGHSRRARIRLAHVGEVAAFPRFANFIGAVVSNLSNGEVDTIVYTRHPKLRELDSKTLVVNLTLDDSSVDRRRWATDEVRIVWSAWNGRLSEDAEINFLEHHDHGQHAIPIGAGNVCPVTISSTSERFCDSFKCAKCFTPPNSTVPQDQEINAQRTERRSLRTRHLSMLRKNTTNPK
jgi:hypothetical protein